MVPEIHIVSENHFLLDVMLPEIEFHTAMVEPSD